MEESLPSVTLQPAASLGLLKAQCRRLFELEQQAADLDKQDSMISAEITRLVHDTLPMIMAELEIEAITVSNHEVVLEPFVVASLPKENLEARKATLDYLVNSGNGGSITRQIIIDLPKGDAIAEQELLEAIKQFAHCYTSLVVNENVHHSTYTSLMKKLVAAGTEGMPEHKTLGLHIGQIVKVVDRK